MVDQTGKPAIDKGTVYVPLRGCSDIDPSTTYCHGTPLSSLWSILATGVMRGGYGCYTELSSFAIWTATDPAECFNYSPMFTWVVDHRCESWYTLTRTLLKPVITCEGSGHPDSKSPSSQLSFHSAASRSSSRIFKSLQMDRIGFS